MIAGSIAQLSYWYSGLADWLLIDPLNPAQIPFGTEFYLCVLWLNTGNERMIGHVEVEITSPSGEKPSLVATEGQDLAADPGSGYGVIFGGITLDEVGGYQAEVRLYSLEDSEKILLDVSKGVLVGDIIGSQVCPISGNFDINVVNEAGGDLDIVSKEIAFSPDSIAVIVGWAVCRCNHPSSVKLRLYVDEVQIAESGYVVDATYAPMIILIGLKAVSGTSICKLGCHNYVANPSRTIFSIYRPTIYQTGNPYTPPLAGIGIGSVKLA